MILIKLVLKMCSVPKKKANTSQGVAKFVQFGGDTGHRHDDYTTECCLDNSGALSGSGRALSKC